MWNNDSRAISSNPVTLNEAKFLNESHIIMAFFKDQADKFIQRRLRQIIGKSAS